jgi:hypothetical protein
VKRFVAALPKDGETPEVRAATSARIINDLDATPLSPCDFGANYQ